MNTIEQTIKVLEWKTILEDLSKHSTCEIGKERCLNAEIFLNAEKIRYELKLTTEGKYLLDHTIYPPLSGIRNIAEFLSIARTGKTLRGEELIDIANTMGASRRLKSFFERYKEEVPALHKISTGLYEDKLLEEDILDIFDEAGNMYDTASPELKRLRVSLKDQTFNLKNKLNSLINSASFSKFLQESVFTLRDDRYVVPVKAEHKSHVPGIVHDISASGSTIFIEPRIIVELNNKLREIEIKIDAEVKRILTELSGRVKEITQEMTYTLEILGDIDFVFAKSKYSISIKATEPEINTEKYISLKSVRHPVLLRVVEKVVPNDIKIGKSFNIMIITGPNTGGKTVVLKTVGICTLMARAGMHIPAVEASIYPFKNIFADIGDEQSIIQSLSTFSGHIKNIINILENADDDTLILIDEVGAGTDPLEGTALAEAILQDIFDKGSRAIITTHFSELKALAYTKSGFYNASVEFDTESLEPTYKLLMGMPGKSNAIYIAGKLGLNENIAKKAREIYLTKKDPTGQVLEGLQNTQQELSKNAKKVEETKENLEKLEKAYNEDIEKIKDEKKKIISVYRKKFDAELLKAKEEIKDILEEIRRTKSEKVSRRTLSKLGGTEAELRQFSQGEKELLEPEFQPLDWDNIKIGDTVLIKHLDQEAVVSALPDKNNNVQVQIGLLKTTVKADELVKTKSGKSAKFKTNIEKPKYIQLKRHQISNELDLRGMSAEDAIDKVEFFLDEASLANLSPIYLIHGHGTGILRKAVREYLKTSPYISKFRAGEQTEGGDGVTVAELA
ncbi:MAG: endonuclease MutS2 [bacterium]